MTQFRFTSAALKELTQATIFYEQRQNGLGTEFLDEVRRLTEPSSSQPLGISCHPERDGVELIVFR